MAIVPSMSCYPAHKRAILNTARSSTACRAAQPDGSSQKAGGATDESNPIRDPDRTGWHNSQPSGRGNCVSQVLPVLTVAYFASPGNTAILEEPEIRLHPLAQSVLAELFVEVAENEMCSLSFKLIPSISSVECKLSLRRIRPRPSNAPCSSSKVGVAVLDCDGWKWTSTAPRRTGLTNSSATASGKRGHKPRPAPGGRGKPPVADTRVAETQCFDRRERGGRRPPIQAGVDFVEEADLRQQVLDWLMAFEADPHRLVVLDYDWNLCGEYTK